MTEEEQPKKRISKLTWGRVATVGSITAILVGWYFSYSNKVNEDKRRKEEENKQHEIQVIYQHDQEQRVDSLANAGSINSVRYAALAKSREESLEKSAIHEAAQDKEIIDLKIRVSVLEKEIDLLISKKIRP